MSFIMEKPPLHLPVLLLGLTVIKNALKRSFYLKFTLSSSGVHYQNNMIT